VNDHLWCLGLKLLWSVVGYKFWHLVMRAERAYRHIHSADVILKSSTEQGPFHVCQSDCFEHFIQILYLDVVLRHVDYIHMPFAWHYLDHSYIYYVHNVSEKGSETICKKILWQDFPKGPKVSDFSMKASYEWFHGVSICLDIRIRNKRQ
jgi:hypothetical protein